MLMLMAIVSVSVCIADSSSFRAGSKAVYGVDETFPGTSANLDITVVGNNNQVTVDQGAQRGEVIGTTSSAGASRTPVADTATVTRRSETSSYGAIDYGAANYDMPPVSNDEGDVCLMPPYNPNDANDKTKFWYYIGCFIDCDQLTIDDSILMVKIPLRDTLIALQGTAVSTTNSAEVGKFIRSKWIGPLITTSDNRLYAFTISDNNGKCVECFEVLFNTGTIQFNSLGWAEIDFSGSGAQLPRNRVRPESAYMIV